MEFVRIRNYLINPSQVIAVEIGITAGRGYAESIYSIVYVPGTQFGITQDETAKLLEEIPHRMVQ